MLQLHTPSFALSPVATESTFELYERIAPVAILYGRGARLHVSEHNSARRLLKELYRLGREGIPVRGMISEHGAISRSSIRALNVYLSVTQWRGVTAKASGLHRFAWYELQREVCLRWHR